MEHLAFCGSRLIANHIREENAVTFEHQGTVSLYATLRLLTRSPNDASEILKSVCFVCRIMMSSTAVGIIANSAKVWYDFLVSLLLLTLKTLQIASVMLRLLNLVRPT
jgi:hypothetical protein